MQALENLQEDMLSSCVSFAKMAALIDYIKQENYQAYWS